MIAVSAAPIVLEGRYRLLVGALVRLRRSRRGRWLAGVGYGAIAIALALLAAHHFATTSWPLSNGDPGLLIAAGLLLLVAQALKAFGWARLFRSDERPSPLALAAGNGVRIGLVVVAAGGVAGAAVIVALPRLSASERALRFRLGRWLSPRTTSLRRASEAWALVSACWLVRAVACFVLLGTLGVGFSFPLALLFLCAGAAAAALPIGPAGAAAQVGAGAAALIASGSRASQALAVAVSVAALGVLSGAAIVLFALASRIRLPSLRPRTPLA